MYTFDCGECSTTGRRQSQEDTSNCDVSFPYFAIHDGHGFGGLTKMSVSNRLKEDTPELVSNLVAFPDNYDGIYVELNNKYIDDKHRDGSTSTLIIADGENLRCYNVGDSEAYLFDTDGNYTELTKVHKPTDPMERALVESRGGKVLNNRVNGILAVSRAFGDYSIHKAITAEPHYSCTKIEDNHTYLVLASDGLYDALDPSDISVFFEGNDDPCTIARNLVIKAYLLGSTDNITVQVVKIQRNREPPKFLSSVYTPIVENIDFSPVDAPLFLDSVKDVEIKQSYFYINELNLHFYQKLGLNLNKPGWVSHYLVSEKIYGNGLLVRMTEAFQGTPFLWATEFYNFHSDFSSQERKITIDNVEYPSAEHFYQIQKFVNTPSQKEAYNELMNADIKDVFRIGRSYELVKGWDFMKSYMMYLALNAKFTQYDDLKQLLRETGDHMILMIKPTDAEWGSGRDGKGENAFGSTLMKIRENL